MKNAELIKALQCKTNDVNDCTTCAYRNACYGGMLELIAADALEAADKRIAVLEEDIKTREAEHEVMQDTIKVCEKRIAELEEDIIYLADLCRRK